MPRTSRHDIVASLRGHGASDAEAEKIVAGLESSGLTPSKMRAWLNHPRRAYSVASETLPVAGVGSTIRHTPLRALRDGSASLGINAVETFRAASPDEQSIARTCLCDIAGVHRLTHCEPTRTVQMAEVARLLLARLGKDVVVNEALQTTFEREVPLQPTSESELRLVDCLVDERLSAVLADLRSGRLDPAELHRTGRLHFFGW